MRDDAPNPEAPDPLAYGDSLDPFATAERPPASALLAQARPSEAPQGGLGLAESGGREASSATSTSTRRSLLHLEAGDQFSEALTVKRRLGKGGMGVVYLAADTHLGRRVAVKVVKLEGDGAKRASMLQRFMAEARATAQLSHPHIVTVHHVGDRDGVPYLVMEEVRGQNLDERIQQGPLSLEEALRLAIQIAKALEHAHERGIVHRDLKPLNTMVQEDGTAKILDFGLAILDVERRSLQSAMQMEPAQLKAMLGEAPLQAGTMAYMAPEQWLGQPQDGRVDLWALGMTLYEMLTGRLPFASALDAVRGDSVPTLSPHTSAPPEVEAILKRALQRHPEDRYASAQEMRRDLEAALDRLHAPPAPSPALPAGLWVALVLVLASVLGAAALLVNLLGDPEGPPSAPSGPPVAAPSPAPSPLAPRVDDEPRDVGSPSAGVDLAPPSPGPEERTEQPPSSPPPTDEEPTSSKAKPTQSPKERPPLASDPKTKLTPPNTPPADGVSDSLRRELERMKNE